MKNNHQFNPNIISTSISTSEMRIYNIIDNHFEGVLLSMGEGCRELIPRGEIFKSFRLVSLYLFLSYMNK
jgi:hypothetical protein